MAVLALAVLAAATPVVTEAAPVSVAVDTLIVITTTLVNAQLAIIIVLEPAVSAILKHVVVWAILVGLIVMVVEGRLIAVLVVQLLSVAQVPVIVGCRKPVPADL